MRSASASIPVLIVPEAPVRFGVLVHVHALPRLTLADRCDACPRQVSQALVAVRLKESGRRLYFCGHHYTKHEPALAALVDAVRHYEPEEGIR